MGKARKIRRVGRVRRIAVGGGGGGGRMVELYGRVVIERRDDGELEFTMYRVDGDRGVILDVNVPVEQWTNMCMIVYKGTKDIVNYLLEREA